MFALLPVQCAVCKSCVVFVLLPAQCDVCYACTTASAVCRVCNSCVVFTQCTASAVCRAGATISPLIILFCDFLLFLLIPTSQEWMSMGLSIISAS